MLFDINKLWLQEVSRGLILQRNTPNILGPNLSIRDKYNNVPVPFSATVIVQMSSTFTREYFCHKS